MIGLVENRLLFEFRDDGPLAYALQAYGNRHESNCLIICDKSNKIKAIVKNGDLISGSDVQEDTKYHLFGFESVGTDVLPKLGDPLPVDILWNVEDVPFICSSQFRTPKPLDWIL